MTDKKEGRDNGAGMRNRHVDDEQTHERIILKLSRTEPERMREIKQRERERERERYKGRSRKC